MCIHLQISGDVTVLCVIIMCVPSPVHSYVRGLGGIWREAGTVFQMFPFCVDEELLVAPFQIPLVLPSPSLPPSQPYYKSFRVLYIISVS